MFFSSKSKTEAGSPDTLPANTAPLPPAPSGNMDSESVKKAIMQQILMETSTNNAKALMENANQHCFDSCVPKPGSTFTSSEQACATQCMEKYVSAWNLVHATYLQRVQKQFGSK